MASFIDVAPVSDVLIRADYVPSNLAAADLLSTTNSAVLCYTKQQFSASLQVFLVNYNITVQNYYSIYK